MPRIRDTITNAALRTSITGWAGEAEGTALVSRASTGFDGAGYLQLAFTAASVPGAVVKIEHAVTPGARVSPGIHVRPSRAQPMKLVVTFINAAGVPIATTYGDSIPVAAGEIRRLSMSAATLGTVPSGAATISIAASVDLALGTAWAAGDTMRASKASATLTEQVIEWFDGASQSSAWVGTANASASDRIFTYPVLTPNTDRDPSPRVGVRFDELHPDTATLTLVVISVDGTVEVRNARKAFAEGGFSIVDYEPPIGVEATYRAQQFNSAGVDLGFTESASTFLEGDPEIVWISDPLDPTSAVPVKADADLGGTLRRRRQMNLVNLGDTTIALMGSMGLLESVPLRCSTDNLEDAAMLDQILSRTIVLIRSSPPHRIPRCLNVAIGDPNKSVWEAQYGSEFTGWDLEGAEVSRTDFDIIVPVITWQAYIDAFPTWPAFNAAYATWLDAADSPPREA